MRKEKQKQLRKGIFLLVMFAVWTIAICLVDVAAIGPNGSRVGFSVLNRLVHNFTGVHMMFYVVTDLLEIVPIACMAGFGVLGLIQWIKRKSFKKVDRDLIALGGVYIAILGIYILFEIFVVNYRPVLIEGILEASYPSSTTMLAMSVMPTTVMQLNARVKNPAIRRCVCTAIVLLAAFIVMGRLISGVHWFTDIVGSFLISSGLVFIYASVIEYEK